MHIELIPGKVVVKIYNRNFTKSSHNYLIKDISEEELRRNHDSITADLSAKSLCIINQVHGIEVANADDLWQIGHEPQADAMICTKKGFVLGIQTADCIPVLIASLDGAIIGAAHCGWKSALDDILVYLQEKMREKTNEKLVAVIGPSIQQKSYEVDNNFYEKFIRKSETYDIFFIRKNSEKLLFDLPGFVKQKLTELDIEVVNHIDDDTYSNPEIYPSFRYASHQGLLKYKGSILSTIHMI